MALDDLFDEEEVYTLTDEDGVESEFRLLASCERDGSTYFALEPLKDNDGGEYVILRRDYDEDTEEETLVTIDDDDEFDTIADVFDDMLFEDGAEEGSEENDGE